MRYRRPFVKRLMFNWERVLKRLRPLGGRSRGNRVSVYFDGDTIFETLLQAISDAKHAVWLETYAFEPDALGSRVRDALADAARRGCEVTLLYDHVGSARISSHFLAPLREAGARAVSFNPIFPWRRRGPLLFRDHRKILVLDQRVAFCGSVNIASDYAGKRLGTDRYRDTHLRIEGPAVHDLSKLFTESLGETTGEARRIQRAKPANGDGMFVQVLGSNTRRNLRAIQHAMEEALKRAKHSCLLTSPYFLPYEPLRKAMLNAARRGVDVRVLTAGLSDVPLMRLASQRVYGQFLEAGIRIYELFGKTLHAKTATIDGVYSLVGSYNLDHWSARRNLEVTVSMLDAPIAKQLELQFHLDLSSAREVTLNGWRGRSWFSRLIQFLAYQLMRL